MINAYLVVLQRIRLSVPSAYSTFSVVGNVSHAGRPKISASATVAAQFIIITPISRLAKYVNLQARVNATTKSVLG